MEAAVEGGRGRWSTALGLTVAVLLLSIFDTLALVLLPVAVLMVGLPGERRARWMVIGAVVWLLGLMLSGGMLGPLSRGWALLLGGIYLILALVRPDWDVISRALASVGLAFAAGVLGLLVVGQAEVVEAMVREHFETVSALTIGDLQSRMPDSAWVADLRGASERISELQARLFPALLGLQSVAALALASWWIRKLGRTDHPAFELHPLREFRFNDQLIWLLIGGIALLILPLGDAAAAAALNVLVFMGGLYVLRGLAVFVFLAAGSKSIVTMVLGALALIFLYPIAFTAALLMGVGDTWLDVRRRVAVARPS
jgi:hypothetical protein